MQPQKLVITLKNISLQEVVIPLKKGESFLFNYLKRIDFTRCLTWPAHPEGHTCAGMALRLICAFLQ